MREMNMIKTGLKPFVLAGAMALAVSPVFGHELKRKDLERVNLYEAEILSGNPEYAKKFLKEHLLIAKYRGASEDKAIALMSKAKALVDLSALLDFKWTKKSINKLSKALAVRIDIKKPLCSVGVGHEPEKLLKWVKKRRVDYGANDMAILEKAIRKWEVIFGTITVKTMAWNQANDEKSVNITREEWRTFTIRERNAVIEQLAWMWDKSCIKYSEELKEFVGVYRELHGDIKSVKNKLTPGQLEKLKDKTLEEQAYLLGGFFDGGKVAGAPDDYSKAKIDAARASNPDEILSNRDRDLIGDMLETSLKKELDNSIVGERIKRFYKYNRGAKIDILLRCEDNYARYDSSTGKIIIDSGLIEKYMRVKGYTAESVIKSKAQMDEIAKFLSPAFVHQTGIQKHDAWAKKLKKYKPLTQEDEVSAASLEALYISEKLKKDKDFKAIFTGMSDFSPYARKRLELAQSYEQNDTEEFRGTVRNLYHNDLLSGQATSSQILYAINLELKRRQSLSREALSEIKYIKSDSEKIARMSASQLAVSARDIKTEVLVKIKEDLSNGSAYDAHYEVDRRREFLLLKLLKRKTLADTKVPPLL